MKNEFNNTNKYNRLDRKYHLKKNGVRMVTEELKQRLMAKVAKIRRYEERMKQYKQNRMFNIDQKRVYKEFNGEVSNERVIPDAEESRRFWKEIWDNTTEHNREAEWLKDLKRGERDVKWDNVVITVEMVRTQCRKIPNWKAPGSDGVQGYWIKNLDALHTCIAQQMDDMLNEKQMVPVWMTLGRTILCLKDCAKGKAANDFRPISCLALTWKLMTGVIAESM